MIWSAANVLAGTAVLIAALARRPRSPLLLHFGIQTLAWGGVELALIGMWWGTLHERDLHGAAQLLTLLWLGVGLGVGCIGGGMTLAIAGWRFGRRLGAIGAGIAVTVQGVALLVLETRLIRILAASLP